MGTRYLKKCYKKPELRIAYQVSKIKEIREKSRF